MHLVTFIFIFGALILAVFAAPLPTGHLEKRITHTGRGTFYHTGLGHCGHVDNDSSPIVAISNRIYNNGVNCNQWIKMTNTANGKTAYGLTRDSCESCGPNDIDLSPSLFARIGSLNTGVLRLAWNFMPRGWHP